jgi:hypothetical protein
MAPHDIPQCLNVVMSKSVVCLRTNKWCGAVDYVAVWRFEAEERVERVGALAVDHIAHSTLDKKGAANTFS